ncbi:MAG: hypothetical protein M3A44_12960 [Gammaproteobacteria bacterium]
MAIGWLLLLKTVPWADVISNAPAVADGAKKLWNTVARKTPPAHVSAEETPTNLSPEAEAIAQVQARIASIETTASELHNQMLASSELIKALADQNTELIKRVEANRIRLLWLSGAIGFLVAIAAISLVLILAR